MKLSISLVIFLCLFGGAFSGNTTFCNPDPCHNGALCKETNITYICQCLDGWSGRNCTETSKVNTSTCDDITCNFNERCLDTNSSARCICVEGYDRDDHGNCSVDIDDCALNPCENNGTCVDGVNEYTCKCLEGFEGDRCQTKSSVCNPNPCQNRGACRELPSSSGGSGASSAPYECLCPVGFVGLHCEATHDACDSNPCVNGVCQQTGGIYTCKCIDGYTGVNCEVDIDDCASNPCINGNCTDLVADFNCSCHPGWNGKTCSINIDECSPDPCVHGTCTDLIAGYNCSCEPGYEGLNCSEDIDDCQSNPCMNNGTCVDGVANFACVCNGTGFQGPLCDEEIDECFTLSPCANNASCHDLINDFECRCHPGYEGKRCEVDVNECLMQPCYNNATCLQRSNQSLYGNVINTSFTYTQAAGFVCLCAAGYTGELCDTEIDECFEMKPCMNGSTCVDEIANYTCLCREGLGGRNCSVALTGCDHGHRCQNNGTCRPYLQNELEDIHNYTCDCLAGFASYYCQSETSMSFSMNSSVTFDIHGKLVGDRQQFSVDFRTTFSVGILLTLLFDEEHSSLQFSLQDSTMQGFITTSPNHDRCQAGRLLNDSNWHSLGIEILTSSVVFTVDDEPCIFTFPSAAISVTKVHLGAHEESFVGCVRDFTVDDQKRVFDEETLPADVRIGCLRREVCFENSCNGRGRCIDLWEKHRCECFRPYVGFDCESVLPPSTFGHMNNESSAYFKLSNQPEDRIEMSAFIRTRAPEGMLLAFFGSSQNSSDIFLSLKIADGKIQVKSNDNETHTLTAVRVDDGVVHFVVASIERGSIYVEVDGSSFLKVNSSHALNLTTADVFVGGIPQQSQGNRRRRSLTSAETPFKGTIQDLQINGIRLLLRNEDTKGLSSSEQSLLPLQTIHVLRGEVSDPVCESTNHNVSDLCLNGGQCVVTFNDYVCNCTEAWQGRNCDQPIYCKQVACPYGSCVDLPSGEGFECVGNVTFRRDTSFSYVTSVNTSSVGSVSLSIRTRSRNAAVLRLSSVDGSLEINIDSSGKIRLKFNDTFQPHVVPMQHMTVADGEWHSIKISASERSRNVSLSVNDVDISIVEQDVIGPRTDRPDFSVEIGALGSKKSFKGCITDVRIGDFLLPFYNLSDLTNHSAALDRAHFVMTNHVSVATADCDGDDVCSTNPCANNGTCTDVFNDYKCTCAPGFTNSNCDMNIDDCFNISCSSHGNCSDRTNGFVCNCFKGYHGALCQDEIDECATSPCLNNGTCHDMIGHYRCNCNETRFVGDHCEIDASHACGDGGSNPNAPCRNGGKCQNVTANDKITYQCHCPRPFKGETCETAIDLCENVTCAGSEECVVDNTTWTSSCVGPCASNPCFNNASCRNENDGYSCICAEGFIGKNCHARNLCENNDLGQFCANNGNCSVTTTANGEPFFICECPPLFAGKKCNFSNPCLRHVCHNGGTCVAVSIPVDPPMAACQCASGYSGPTCMTMRDQLKDIWIIVGPILGAVILFLLLAVTTSLVCYLRGLRETTGTYSPQAIESMAVSTSTPVPPKLPPERLI